MNAIIEKLLFPKSYKRRNHLMAQRKIAPAMRILHKKIILLAVKNTAKSIEDSIKLLKFMEK